MFWELNDVFIQPQGFPWCSGFDWCQIPHLAVSWSLQVLLGCCSDYWLAPSIWLFHRDPGGCLQVAAVLDHTQLHFFKLRSVFWLWTVLGWEFSSWGAWGHSPPPGGPTCAGSTLSHLVVLTSLLTKVSWEDHAYARELHGKALLGPVIARSTWNPPMHCRLAGHPVPGWTC